MGVQIRGPGAGLTSAAFVGIVPSYISRSVAGSYDNEGVAIFALMFVFFFYLKVLCPLQGFCQWWHFVVLVTLMLCKAGVCMRLLRSVLSLLGLGVSYTFLSFVRRIPRPGLGKCFLREIAVSVRKVCVKYSHRQ